MIGFSPFALAVDESDNLYIAGDPVGTVWKLNSAGQLISEFSSAFDSSPSLAITGGALYVLEPWTNRLRVFEADGRLRTTYVSPPDPQAPLRTPGAVDVTATGQIIVTSDEDRSVRVLDTQGRVANRWVVGGIFLPDIEVGPDTTIYLYQDNYMMPGVIKRYNTNGMLLSSWEAQWPDSLSDFSIAPTGDLYVRMYIVASNSEQIGRYTADGVLVKSWRVPSLDLVSHPQSGVYVLTYPNIVSLYGPDGVQLGQWQSNHLHYPSKIAILPNGDLAILDYLDSIMISSRRAVVQVFRPDGLWRGTWGGTGSGEGEMNMPRSLTFFQDGRAVIADGANNRIQIFDPMTYTKPIATITHVSAPSIGQGDTLILSGMGQDSDETPGIAAYRWISDKDGVIGTGPTVTRAANTLTPGSHQITLEVQDTEGEWSVLPAHTSIFVAAPPQVTWTALLYLAGDYGDRGSQLNAFNAAIDKLQTSLRNPAIRVAAQIDGPADGDTYRVLIIPSNPPQVTRLENIGEQAMDTSSALAAFLRWGQANFPAPHYYLAIANHGQALQGIAWDRTSDLKDDGVLNDSAYLTPTEIGQGLHADGVAPIDVIHLDACSMDLLEVAYELRPLADVPAQSRLLIASQYLGWNYFAYDTYITAIGAGDTPAQVALTVTGAYAERAKADKVPYTIAALDLGRAGPMATAVDNLGAEMAAYINNDRSRLDAVDAIWQASSHFESNGDYLNNQLDEYLDLPTWASKVQLGIASPAIKQRAFELITELTGPSPFILSGSNHVGHGSLPTKYAAGAFIDLSGASGVSIFYPGRQDTVAFDSYINNRLFAFTSATRWADFLIAGRATLGLPPIRPLPGPLTGMDVGYRVMLPLIRQ